MLKSLEYSNTFPSTGRTLKGSVDFKAGFGSITGPNESGKSFILEMIRFCLFGSAALRGVAEDYKKLSAKLTFAVKGLMYVVARKGTNATVTQGDTVLAVGIKPVNEKIASILGYGLEVFDVANVSNQDDLSKLGSMKPSERKRMVDSVIGLGVVEDVGKWANDQALEKIREIETIEKIVVRPTEPTPPPAYRHSSEIRTQISDMLILKTEHDQLVGALRESRNAPTMPKEKGSIPAEMLLQFVHQQDAIKARQASITLPPAPPPFSVADLEGMLAQHDQADQWDAFERFTKLHPKATHTQEQLDEMLRTWDEIAEFEATARFQRELEKALAHGENVCPNCDHHWPVAAVEVDRLRGLVANGVTVRPADPELGRKAIDQQLDRLADKATIDPAPQAVRPRLSRQEIGSYQNLWGRQGDRETLMQELASLKTQLASMPDYRTMYNERVAYEAASKRFIEEAQEFQAWMVKQAGLNARRAELAPQIANIDALQAEAMIAAGYETAVASYNAQLDTYQLHMERIEALKIEAVEWKKAKNALITLRLLVKQHLLPSLNKIASGLIKTMTGAQRQSIVVDDEFDVTVDGQALNTLSGSGKAVANLALRIGLGQVLTNGVLSVFIGDEIDASMDKDRAENTANTLQLLKSRISQILLVTHKYPPADYYIELGKSENENAGRSPE